MKDLVKQFEETKEQLDFLEREIYSRSKEIFMPKILNAKSLYDIQAIKIEVGDIMPNCASKVLIFRSIILKEEQIKNEIRSNNI